MGLSSVMNRLQYYGYNPHSLMLANLSTRSARRPSIGALKAKFLELLPTYMGALRGEVNPYFKMLLSRRQTLHAGGGVFLLGLFTASATKAMWLAIDMVYLATSTKKKILFISDKDTEGQLNLSGINCMLYGSHLHAFIDELSRISYYYNSRPRTNLPRVASDALYFDLVVVCLRDYTRVDRTTFQPFARFTLGFCTQSMRPDLFDYYVPAMGTYESSVRLVRDVAILGYLAR